MARPCHGGKGLFVALPSLSIALDDDESVCHPLRNDRAPSGELGAQSYPHDPLLCVRYQVFTTNDVSKAAEGSFGSTRCISGEQAPECNSTGGDDVGRAMDTLNQRIKPFECFACEHCLETRVWHCGESKLRPRLWARVWMVA
ncbi:hypothetical protein EV421DRAFT_970438 [Armillaria borealis]|uniref:Uncharacterized protein n=1 Tax=Armillaria borealis TaxID=47425 RepID=A0AA39IBZ7_9AGAR|nr:hypothetical protein EV421DRAFT_970438 [Armillaria borealis]